MRGIRTALTYKGETHSFKEWATITRLPLSTIRTRFYSGWSPEDILERPVNKIPLLKYKGQLYSLEELADIGGINYHTAYGRWKSGWVPDAIVEGRIRRG
jgi:hypothetical protein